MNRQAAYNLPKCFLEKRGTTGIDLKRELPDLLDYGVTRGIFTDPNTVFEEEEWRKLGDKLFDAIIAEEKAARKLLKPWRTVTNTLKMHKAEQRVAAAAAERLSNTASARTSAAQQNDTTPPPDCPLPPSVRTLMIPQSSAGPWNLSQSGSALEDETPEPPQAERVAPRGIPAASPAGTAGANGLAEPMLEAGSPAPRQGTIWVPSRWVQPAVEEHNKGSPRERPELLQGGTPDRDQARHNGTVTTGEDRT